MVGTSRGTSAVNVCCVSTVRVKMSCVVERAFHRDDHDHDHDHAHAVLWCGVPVTWSGVTCRRRRRCGRKRQRKSGRPKWPWQNLQVSNCVITGYCYCLPPKIALTLKAHFAQMQAFTKFWLPPQPSAHCMHTVYCCAKQCCLACISAQLVPSVVCCVPLLDCSGVTLTD